ncbi:MAG: rhodanese-like domain-containing protein [Microbacterium sp.]
MHFRRSLTIAALLLASALGVTACTAATSTVEISEETIIVDVRTPEEFATGHLEGAVNVDLQSGDFEGQITSLPVDGEYVVYCRSGNRSAQAVDIMTTNGFEDVIDAGGIDAAASATGLAVVTE